jgi:hypothetical protein
LPGNGAVFAAEAAVDGFEAGVVFDIFEGKVVGGELVVLFGGAGTDGAALIALLFTIAICCSNAPDCLIFCTKLDSVICWKSGLAITPDGVHFWASMLNMRVLQPSWLSPAPCIIYLCKNTFLSLKTYLSMATSINLILGYLINKLRQL